VSPGSEDVMAQAVQRHFSFRLNDLAKEKISSWREGKVSVALALVNACISVILFYIFYNTVAPSFSFSIIIGVFVIMNWVTIWDTYEYFLYDYRKLWRKYQVYKKLTRTQVTIRQIS
jgi:amino acid transporter